MRQSETERYFRKLNAQDDFYVWTALFFILFIIFGGWFLLLFIGTYFIQSVCIGSAIGGLCVGENATEKWIGILLLPVIFGGVAWLIKAIFFPDVAQHFYDLIGSFG